jgi:molybdopterin-synthase adenylyltransferase
MRTIEVRVPGDLQDQLFADLTRDVEWAGYLLCGLLRYDGREVLLARSWHAVPESHRVPGTGHGFSWHSDFDVQMLNDAQAAGLSCVILHYHGGKSPALGHTSDRNTADSLMPFLSREAPSRPHVFAVLGDRSASGIAYRDGQEIGALNSYRVTSHSLDDWSVAGQPHSIRTSAEARHDRMIRGFGRAAHSRVGDSRIGVVGCGGGGSHVIQQLAYLGIGHLVLVDPDLVEETNLNRLIGATPGRFGGSILRRLLRGHKGDVGRLKVDVMHAMASAINPSIEVTRVADRFPSTASVAALKGVDLIVSCVDQLQVRDDLNRLAKRYLIPMVDIGIEIAPEKSGEIRAIPGRVTKVLADGPCLRCQDIITDRKLELERGGKPQGYVADDRLPDPAVVTLNGLVASAATTEVLQLLTGFAGGHSPNCGWIYDGLNGTLERAAKPYRPTSPCEEERGAGDP